MTDKERYDFLKRIEDGEAVYFFNSLEDAAIKSLSNNKYEVKLKNAEPFISEPVDNKLSSLITDGLIEAKEISKKEYDSY